VCDFFKNKVIEKRAITEPLVRSQGTLCASLMRPPFKPSQVQNKDLWTLFPLPVKQLKDATQGHLDGA
jgi:hypothetical protein